MRSSPPQELAAVLSLPHGCLAAYVEADGGPLVRLALVAPDTALMAARGAVAGELALQLVGYLCNPAQVFDVPSEAVGTPFQRRVWQRLRAIPRGQTLSYGQLAAELGSGARAVAGACRANPLPIMVPCHRVVAARGDGGYAGYTEGWPLALKRWLLEHERSH